jgi:hypothetical protein
MNSCTFFEGTPGATTSTLVIEDSKAIGAKSCSGR